MVLSNPSIYLSLFLGLSPACSASEVCVKAQVLAQAVLSDIRSTQVITHDTVYFNTTLFYQKSIVLWVSIYLSAFFSTSPFVWVQKKNHQNLLRLPPNLAVLTSIKKRRFICFSNMYDLALITLFFHLWSEAVLSWIQNCIWKHWVLTKDLWCEVVIMEMKKYYKNKGAKCLPPS